MVFPVIWSEVLEQVGADQLVGGLGSNVSKFRGLYGPQCLLIEQVFRCMMHCMMHGMLVSDRFFAKIRPCARGAWRLVRPGAKQADPLSEEERGVA